MKATPDSIDMRRRRIYSIRSNSIVDMLNWWFSRPATIAMPLLKLGRLPDDAFVLTVYYSFERLVLDFIVVSAEFELVADGEIPPRFASDVCDSGVVYYQNRPIQLQRGDSVDL